MTPPTTPDGDAYEVADANGYGQVELYPRADGEVAVVVRNSDGTADRVRMVSAHTLVRAAVAAALDAFEDLHSPRADGAGEHDPSRTEQFRTDREQEN
jgi:hypothetical protein